MEEHGEHSASAENESAQETGGSSAEPRERCPACGFMNEAGADTCAQCEQRLMPADIKPVGCGVAFVHPQTPRTSEESERPVAADEHGHEESPMDSRAAPPPATGAESPARQLQGKEFRYLLAPPQGPGTRH